MRCLRRWKQHRRPSYQSCQNFNRRRSHRSWWENCTCKPYSVNQNTKTYSNNKNKWHNFKHWKKQGDRHYKKNRRYQQKHSHSKRHHRYCRSSSSDSSTSCSMSSDSETDTENGFDTANDDSGTDYENYPRQNLRTNNEQNYQNRGGRGRRAGRRQRQRNRRNRREAEHSESWYFPNGRQENDNQEDENARAALIEENENWIANLPVLASQLERQDISPLAQNNRDHRISWADNTGRFTVLPVNRPDEDPVAAVLEADPDTEDQEREGRIPMPNPIITTRPESRQAQRRDNLPTSSNTDVNFNLSNQLAERNRVLQMLSTHASQVQVAAAAAAASLQQLVDTARQSSNFQNVLDNVNSWINWSTATAGSDNDVNLAASDSRQLSGDEERYRRAARRIRNNRSRRQAQRERRERAPMRGNNQQSLHRGWYDVEVSREEFHDSQTTLIPQTDSSQLIGNQQTTETQNAYQQLNNDDDDNPFARYDAAFRRQEERNEWRDRHRRRHNRHDRRNMENRRRERRRTLPNLSSTSQSALESQENIDITRPGTDSSPPPLPPRIEWEEALIRNSVPSPISQQNGRQDAEMADASEISDDESMASATSGGAMDVDDFDPLEALLKSYIDPGESNTPLGQFIRSISNQSRVIISRVRTRITRQYFRKGDFQMALADFRTLNPEHARQVLGVGFTGTINNMYRLTVKQNSSFGKPTLEIRPMNKRVRKKKVHVCYKIRYLYSRERGRRAPRRPPISTPV